MGEYILFRDIEHRGTGSVSGIDPAMFNIAE
jgi:hypothetical protein